MYSASDRLETGNFIFFSSTSNCGKAADITCAFLYPDKEELQLSHWENETLKKNGDMNLNGDKFGGEFF